MRSFVGIVALAIGCGGGPASPDAGGDPPDALFPDGGADPDGGGVDPDAGPGWCGAITCPVDPLQQVIDYRGVWGAADDAIWVVGLHGTIRFFDGDRWTAQASGTEADLLAVHGTARDDVWAVGAYGTVLHFDGSAWSPVAIDESEALLEVVAVSRTDAWIAGGDRLRATFVHHWNGSAWSADGPSGARGLVGIDADATRVVVATADALWERSGGAWDSVTSVFEPYDVALVAGEVLLLKRDFGDVSADDGDSSTDDLTFFSGATYIPYRIAARALDRIAIVGEGGVISERDGAEDRHGARTQHDFHAAWIAPDGTLWAVGDAGTIVRAEGARMRTIDAGDQRTMLAVHARASDDVWAAGLAGNVLHYDGSAWTLVASGADVDLRAITAAADGSLWVAGEEGVAVRFVGMAPERHDVGVAVDIVALATDERAAIWAAGGTTLRRWDGGAWTEVAALDHVVNDACSPSPGEIWLAEEDGHAQRFVDGVDRAGFDLGGGEGATAIWGTSAEGAYVALRGPSLRRWDGTTWLGVTTPSVGLDAWTSIFGVTGDDILAVGRTTIRHDGATWTEVNAGSRLVDVHGVGRERWAVGWNAELRYGVLE